MNHRERILAAIRHQPVDRLPTDIWATVEVQEKLFAHFDLLDGDDAATSVGFCGGGSARGPRSFIALLDRLDIDGIVNIAPPYIGPPKRVEEGYTYNEWGMGYRWQEYATGSYNEQVIFPLAGAETIEDLKAYPWPDPDWYDYAALPGLAAASGGRAICCGYTAPFYFHNQLRGLETSMIDPALRPQFTEYLVSRISDFFTEYHTRCFEATRGSADMTQVTDDFGSQSGLLISTRMFDCFYRAPLQRAIDLAKSYGLYIFHHDDGDCRPLLPRLVEMGIDILNPIQWRCGDWDLTALKAQYGRRLCFHSAVDNQQTLPFGTPEDVRAEVKHLCATLGRDGTGFIIGPCHNLQAVSPVENILAMYDAAREYGTVAGWKVEG
jgi:uroporphyrinogen decarboxylase